MLRIVSLLVAAALLVVPAAAVQRVSLGDRLERDYTVYTPVPSNSSAAQAAGWVPMNGGACQAKYGVLWAQDASGPSPSKPMSMFFTPGGQAAGMGMLFTGTLPQNLVDRGYFEPMGDYSMMTLTYRSADDVCATSQLKEPLGDRIIINAGSIAEEVPLTRDEAASAGWIKGSCFQGMGTHWFKDLTGNSMSWTAANLLPLVTMYDEEGTRSNLLQAYFFATPVVQQSLTTANQWDGIPLPNILMCKNFCDSKCTFKDTWFTSTLHVYTRDRAPVTCPNDCTIGCCPSNNLHHNPLAKLRQH